MRLLLLGLLLLLGHLLTLAQLRVPEVKVFAGDGVLIFHNITIISGPKGCQLKSFVENLSDSAYVHLELKATVKSDALRLEFPLTRFSIVAKGTQLISMSCPVGTPAKGALSLSYVRGLTLLPETRNGNQSSLVAQYFWSLPVVKSDLGVVLLGGDKGCANTYGKAVDSGGLEGRKAIRELESLGCGHFIQSGSWVRIDEDGTEYVLVEEVDSPPEPKPKRGWVQKRFLAPPEAYSLDAAIARALRTRVPEQPQAPMPPKPATAIQARQSKTWEVVDIDARITESNDVWSRMAWKLRLANKSASPIKFAGEIVFEDADGFIVDSDRVFDLILGPASEEVFTGAALIKSESIGKVKGVRAKVAPVN